MNKAFIFDMDGVIINSEQMWVKHDDKFLLRLLGKNTTAKIGNTIGMTVNAIYDIAAKNGFTMKKERFLKHYDIQAAKIYEKAQLTQGLDQLIDYLTENGFKLGLVSSSRQNWIDKVLTKLTWKKLLGHIISINERPDLKPKPNPDSYLEAIKILGAFPKTTIILEDSNSGIKAGKAAGALVIGFQANLVPGYTQLGADVYAKNVDEVIKIVSRFLDHNYLG